jgi:hypothetical protein
MLRVYLSCLLDLPDPSTLHQKRNVSWGTPSKGIVSASREYPSYKNKKNVEIILNMIVERGGIALKL